MNSSEQKPQKKFKILKANFTHSITCKINYSNLHWAKKDRNE